MTKQVSRFARLRSEDEAFESLADESTFGDVENDPKALRKWVREMSKAMDEDMDEELDAALEEEMAGDSDGSATEPADNTVY